MPLTVTTVRSAERARRELAATARTARKRAAPAARAAGAGETLTAQEAQVALLARDGLSNPEIGARPPLATPAVTAVTGRLALAAWQTRAPPSRHDDGR